MFTHHYETIQNIKTKFVNNKDVIAVLLVGSIAHGYAREDSDVDIMIIIDEDSYNNRVEKQELTFYDETLTTYEGGYVDGKYISVNFMKEVRDSGSEASRYAFHNASFITSKDDGLSELLKGITKYSIGNKEENIQRFYSQFEAWKWYCDEAIKHDNRYLLNHSISKLTLFGGRMFLTYNERLFPYHKWFLKVLSEVSEKPEDLMMWIEKMHIEPSVDNINGFYNCVKGFYDWNTGDIYWTDQFAKDSELNWLNKSISVIDI